jgi:hypothetical protein
VDTVDAALLARERLLLQALRSELATINVEFFGGGLRPAQLTLDDSTLKLAHWRRIDRTISVARAFLTRATWTAVREVLKHESAHQYVDEVLRVEGESAHGETFRRVCADRGIDAAAAGAIDGDAEVRDVDVERVLRRVEKLLALAASDNKNEAEAAADAAQRLMLEHNLAAQHRPRRYVVRPLGKPVTRMHAHEKLLGALLSQHYFVDTIIVRAWCDDALKMGTVLEVAGTPENVEMASWVHAFLLGAAERCFRDEHRQRQLPQRERLPFFAGFMMGVQDKLERESKAKEERGLVWVGDADLEHYAHLRHPRVRRGRIAGAVREGHQAGREAGNEVVIGRPLDEAPAQRGRLLGGRADR